VTGGGLFEPTEAKLARAGDDDRRLIEIYVRTARTLDDLPYTDEFESLYAALAGETPPITRRAVLHRLYTLRKAGKLPKLGRAESASVKVTPDDEARLASMVTSAVGSLGQRDQLLYDPRFDAIVQEFNADTGRNLHPHDLWRLVAKLAK